MITHPLTEWVTVFVVVALAMLAWTLIGRVMQVVEQKQWLPPTAKVLVRGFLRWSVLLAVVLYIFEVVGLPVRALWTGILSVALLVAVAFVAVWSVLSNILSAVLLLTFSRARIGDIVELKETKQEEVGIRGKIVDINLFFVTIEELFVDEKISSQPAMVQIPCHLFFYRVTRCWAGVKTLPLMNAFQDDKPEPTPAEDKP